MTEAQTSSQPPQPGSAAAGSLSETELHRIDAYWRAANYLSVGQIYLLDNPLLTEPLRPEQVKPRLLGHWGTTPGLNLLSVHLNRVIRNWDLNAIYIIRPGHGGPGILANASLEGAYTEVYRPSAGMPPAELAATLEHRSGLLGLAGTADMREILGRAEAGDPDASLALDTYMHRLRAAIAAVAASLGGLDALVFTGGVGENAPGVRERACQNLAFLGVALDADRNIGARGDRDIGAEAAPVRTLLIVAREDLQIAHEVRTVLGT